ncbi:MAG TPA: DPP IV N-terminal domain-containing protein [Bacteroidales bacterium]
MNRFLKLFILSGIIFQSAFLFSQEKLLTIDDISYKNRSIFPKRIPQLQWVGSSDSYAYAKENTVFQVIAKNGKESVLLDLNALNSALQSSGFDTLNKLPALDFSIDEVALFNVKNKYYRFNLSERALQQINIIPDSAENIDYNIESGEIAYTLKNNLYYSSDGELTAITNDSDPGIVNGQTVHRNEFGIKKGIFWSPDGLKIAFYRKDETMVTDYPLVNINTRVATVENTKYPMAGMTSEQVTLGIYDLLSGETVFAKTGEPKDQYLTAITWAPDSKSVYIGLLNREQNHLRVNQYDAQSGDSLRTVFEEQDPKYVEPENPLYFEENNNTQFIWVSETDGYDQLYLYSANSNKLTQLTTGTWVVSKFLGYYGNNTAYFLGTLESPLQKNIYSVNTKTGKITRISPDDGTHTAMVSQSGNYIIDAYSNTTTSLEYKLLSSQGKAIRTIQEDSNPLKDYKLGEISIFKLQADDGTDLYCRMIKPIDFDNTKKYPVIVYVYGGPHDQEVSDSWLGGASLVLNYYAEQGFLVFSLDNRGTAFRGRDFEQAIHRNLGTIEVSDQMVGVNYLKSLPYVDSTRIGVDGWSYGGFMTISMMLKNPGVFKVGVAGGPVIDWQYYEVMYGERYMDTPQENPEGYKNANLLNHMDSLSAKLMIIHGTMDPTVVWQQSLLFVQKAISLGKQIDYFSYPSHGHGVGYADRDHLNELIFNYFKENL